MEDEKLRGLYQDRSERQIKWYLIQEKIMKAEEINISADELKLEIQNMYDITTSLTCLHYIFEMSI